MTTQTGRISQRKTNQTGSTLPEIGKIKVGEKVKKSTGAEYPTSLDYFKATGNFAAAFNAQYGEKPKSLTVAFISDDLNEVCNERYECWDKGKRWGWGDGETFTVWDAAAKEYKHDILKTDPLVTGKKWDTMLTLRFILLDMKGILGYWTFQSKGKSTSIPSIIKSFDFVREKSGTIVGFPFQLVVEKKVGYNPGEAKSYPMVTLVPCFTEEAMEKIHNYLEQGGAVSRINTNFVKAQEALAEGAVSVTMIPQSTEQNAQDTDQSQTNES